MEKIDQVEDCERSGKSNDNFDHDDNDDDIFSSTLYSYDDDDDDDDYYHRVNVTNVHPGKDHFDQGLRLLLSYQQEEASHYFLACLKFAPHCALAHALVALCHSPNYNFKGEPYYQASFPPSKNVKEQQQQQQQQQKQPPQQDDSTHNNVHEKQPQEISSNVEFDFSSFQEDSKSSTMLINPPSFPSQLFADYHSRRAVEKVQELEQCTSFCSNSGSRNGRSPNGTIVHMKQEGEEKKSAESPPPPPSSSSSSSSFKRPQPIQDVEVMLINAIRCLNKNPGVDPSQAETINGQPFAKAMRNVYTKYPHDAEVAYFFVESIMILHAWNLFEYPTGKPLSQDVPEVQLALEKSLELHPQHVGLCHMYVHLCEMATYPEKALNACHVLRHRYVILSFLAYVYEQFALSSHPPTLT